MWAVEARGISLDSASGLPMAWLPYTASWYPFQGVRVGMQPTVLPPGSATSARYVPKSQATSWRFPWLADQLTGFAMGCVVTASVLYASAYARGCAVGMQISMCGESGLVEALPKSCERVDLEWTGEYGTLGQTAGLTAYSQINLLSLQGFRCSHLARSLSTCITVKAPVCPVHHAAVYKQCTCQSPVKSDSTLKITPPCYAVVTG